MKNFSMFGVLENWLHRVFTSKFREQVQKYTPDIKLNLTDLIVIYGLSIMDGLTLVEIDLCLVGI